MARSHDAELVSDTSEEHFFDKLAEENCTYSLNW